MNKIHDLRSYIAELTTKGALARLQTPVSIELELANVAAMVTRQQDKAVIFEEVMDFDWPVFACGVSSPARAAIALECDVNHVVDVMGKAMEPANALAPVPVTEAAWKANVITGKDIDLSNLPIPQHASGDGGRFITGGVTVSRDPVSGRGNLGYNRMQILAPNILGFNLNEWRHVMQFLRHQESEGKPLEVAIAIGLDPAIMISAGARYDDDELLIAGAIRGSGVPVCKGVTVDLDIPAEAEIVIEGRLLSGERRGEGPLAEFHGYYGEIWDSPVFEVSAICHRDDPIFQTIIPGWDEHIYIGNVLPREPLLMRMVRHVSSNVTGLHIPPYTNGFSAIVQIEKQNPGEPKNAAMAAMMAHVNIKQVIVVDPDVNIFDPADVFWALTTRVDWSRDVFYVPGSQGHEMDPTADMRGVHTKLGIDATSKPDRRDYGERVQYPPLDLSVYLQPKP
jgi:2,5-furandicarboxylate decarboxylase 1